ncbi:MAG: phosphate--acyl-ACP acyltransferase, partial [bacterium]
LSIGEESSKGNELVVEAHRLLSESSLNFIGNVEGSDILKGTADVVVCDGFVGNVILKFTESVIGMLSVRVRERAMASPTWKLGAFLLRPVFEEIRREMDYQEYGGAPLLGVDGVVVICHGSSSAKAISNAIKVAQRMVQGRVNDHIKEHLQRDGQAKGES